MAVLIRSSKSECARQRVEDLLHRWESRLKRTLPRPVVLEGDLLQAGLGLDGHARRWLQRNCESVIHNAASLNFRADDADGEPFRSNVEGTRRMLELCRCTGIRKFHHVSTAYVCGLREGRILEGDVDVGQPLGNVYEKSKLEAELLVRGADFLDPPTIYRPSIIVGDSQTGYTTTYHGFYVPLKLAHTMASKVVRGATAGRLLMGCLGLRGAERKNFVPVNWVSAVMSRIYGRPEMHGRTFHLTSSRPTPIVEMAATFQEAVEAYSPLAEEDDGWVLNGDWFEQTFREQMTIYGAYWRDDPEFDTTNTRTAAPDLDCPDIDQKTMLKLAEYAIDANFGRRRPAKHRPEFDVQQYMTDLLGARNRLEETRNPVAHFGLQVNGPGGGQWELFVDNGRVVAADHGVSGRAKVTYHLTAMTLQQLMHRGLTVRQAVEDGHVRIEGNGMPRERLEAVLQAAATTIVSDHAQPSLMAGPWRFGS
jgi:nucleoside-diphosphate-sugar epimerase